MVKGSGDKESISKQTKGVIDIERYNLKKKKNWLKNKGFISSLKGKWERE